METIEDIVREVAEEMLNTSMQEITAERIHGWATRLGDAATCEKSSQVGNAAAMREALVKCRALAETIWQSEGGEDVSAEIAELKDRINAALSAPARNCDRFNNWKDAFQAFYNSLAIEHPPMSDGVSAAFLKWLFAEAKGGAE